MLINKNYSNSIGNKIRKQMIFFLALSFTFFNTFYAFSFEKAEEFSRFPYEFNLGYLFVPIVRPEEIKIGDENFSIPTRTLHGLLVGLRYKIWDIFEVSDFKFRFGGTSRFGGAVGGDRISLLLLDISTFYISVERNIFLKFPVDVEFALGTGSFGGTGLFVNNPSRFKISLIPLPLYFHLGANTEIANISVGIFASANFLNLFSLANYMTEQGTLWKGGMYSNLMKFAFGISLGFGKRNNNDGGKGDENTL